LIVNWSRQQSCFFCDHRTADNAAKSLQNSGSISASRLNQVSAPMGLEFAHSAQYRYIFARSGRPNVCSSFA
jgi:hypothetical protein